MTEELRAKMEELRAIAPRLNKTSDTAAAIIRSVEEFLNGLGIGVSGTGPWFSEQVWASDDDPPVTKTSRSYLGYGRMRDKFSIHVIRQTTKEEPGSYGGPDDVLEDEEQVPWSTLSREMKLKSFATLPKMLDRILLNAKEQVAAADLAAASMEEMLVGLGQSSEPDDKKPAPIGRTRPRRKYDPAALSRPCDGCGRPIDVSGISFEDRQRASEMNAGMRCLECLAEEKDRFKRFAEGMSVAGEQ